jgi:hypothetical protein
MQHCPLGLLVSRESTSNAMDRPDASRRPRSALVEVRPDFRFEWIASKDGASTADLHVAALVSERPSRCRRRRTSPFPQMRKPGVALSHSRGKEKSRWCLHGARSSSAARTSIRVVGTAAPRFGCRTGRGSAERAISACWVPRPRLTADRTHFCLRRRASPATLEPTTVRDMLSNGTLARVVALPLPNETAGGGPDRHLLVAARSCAASAAASSTRLWMSSLR